VPIRGDVTVVVTNSHVHHELVRACVCGCMLAVEEHNANKRFLFWFCALWMASEFFFPFCGGLVNSPADRAKVDGEYAKRRAACESVLAELKKKHPSVRASVCVCACVFLCVMRVCVPEFVNPYVHDPLPL
jgi:hypothetical protein